MRLHEIKIVVLDSFLKRDIICVFGGWLCSFCYADILLEKGEIKSEEIWDIYKRAPRIPQVVLELDGIAILSAALVNY